jgi:hypothetical protein
MTYQYSANLKILRYSVGFETNCDFAFKYLQNIRSFFKYRQYQFVTGPTSPDYPLVRYQDSSSYNTTYFPSRKIVMVRAPYKNISRPNSDPFSVLLVPLWQATELTRQTRGEYFLHASAVEYNGRGMVLLGQSESGKTTVALDLCKNYGCSLYANDQSLVSFRNDKYWLIFGDSTFNFRYSSLLRYDVKMARALFGFVREVTRPWELKKIVDPQEIGVNTCSGEIPLQCLFLLKLDETVNHLDVMVIDDSNKDELFVTKIQFHWELAKPIRGGYAPLGGNLDSTPFFIPSFDCPEFLGQRNRFIDALFARRMVIKVRGPLKKVTGFIADCARSIDPNGSGIHFLY